MNVVQTSPTHFVLCARPECPCGCENRLTQLSAERIDLKSKRCKRNAIIRPLDRRPQRPAALRPESLEFTTKENLKCAARCLLVLS